jgi:hypothetical protein
MKRRSFLGLLPILLLVPDGVCSPPNPNFSGTWKLSGERSIPKRNGNVTLRIEHRDPELTVETTMVRGSGEPRHALQRYTTDGKVSISTGADGDEFHTSIAWKGTGLIFSVEEHEDGRVIHSTETWTMIDNGTALQRDRENLDASADGTRRQTLIYLRESPEKGAISPH